jgi:hypothetical protein
MIFICIYLKIHPKGTSFFVKCNFFTIIATNWKKIRDDGKGKYRKEIHGNRQAIRKGHKKYRKDIDSILRSLDEIRELKEE